MTDKKEHFFKICVTGEFGVGKTSTIVRYVEGTFHEDTKKTTEFEHKVKQLQIEDRFVKARVCDSVGEERFSALTASFFRGAHAVMFVFDVSNKESADNLQKWYNEVDRYVDARNLPKIILANKWDLSTDKAYEQKITEALHVGEELASNWKCKLIKTSAKTSENVNEAFEALIRSCIEKSVGTTFSNNNGAVNLTSNQPKKRGCIV